MTTRILRIDASARTEGSVSRELNDRIVDRFAQTGPVSVTHRDLSQTQLPFLDATWIGATFTPADKRSEAQAEALALSDTLVEELAAADVVVIGLPIYNFGVPASLKAWIDMVARAGVTFAYTEDGPRGLLDSKRAIISVASGGTEIGSEIDFVSGYLRHMLGFMGIRDVSFVSADRLSLDPETTLSKAHDAIDHLALAA